MNLLDRLIRLWDLSGTTSQTVEAVEPTGEVKSFTVKRKPKPAIIVEDDPPEFFPIAEEEYDTTSKQSPTN